MVKLRPKSEVWATRNEVAQMLNLSPRQIDRLCRDGTLIKQKTSHARSGIVRTSIDDYLRQRNPSTGNSIDEEAGSGCSILIVDLPQYHPHAARLVDEFISGKFPGCMVWAEGARITIIWAWSLDYNAAAIREHLRQLEVRAMVLA